MHRFLAALVVLLALLAPRPVAARGLLHSFADLRNISTAQTFSTAFSPDEIATAYGFAPLYSQSLDGTGQTVALIEIDGFDPADISYFDNANSLPDPQIQQTYVGGKQFTLGKGGETAMDLEWLHALAPGATLQVYYVDNNASDAAIWRSMARAVQQATAAGARTISISLGTCSAGPGSASLRSAFHSAMGSGVSIFVSSGDTGDRPGSVQDCGKKVGVAYPASDPSVVSVGGTSLALRSNNLIARESAWHKSGGGKASYIIRPPWEVAPTLHKDSYRWAPDVAFVGDPNTGVSMYFNGRFHQAGGTSLGAPCWAAAWAIALQNAQLDNVIVGAAPSLLYRIGNSTMYRQVFHDVTTGSNGKYKAGAGWDPVTGWGTPNVQSLAGAVEELSQ